MSVFVHELRVESIVVGKRLRTTSDAAVAELRESLRRTGKMLQPIVIYAPDVVPNLVCGAHRLAAAKLEGWETVPCLLLPMGTTEDDCLAIEIAENLHRNELTKDERDQHIRLLAEIIARKDAEVSQHDAAKPESGRQMQHVATPVLSDGRRAGPQHEKGVVRKVAEQTGLSKDTVRRALNPKTQAWKKAKAKADREERASRQAEHDRQRNEARASLPESIQLAEAAKEVNRQKARQGAVMDPATASEILSEFTQEDRVTELEEAVRELEARNVELEAENKLYRDMKASWQQGGYEKVIADRDEQIRVLREQFHSENAEKVREQRKAKRWEKILREQYRHFEPTVIDPATQSVVRD